MSFWKNRKVQPEDHELGTSGISTQYSPPASVDNTETTTTTTTTTTQQGGNSTSTTDGNVTLTEKPLKTNVNPPEKIARAVDAPPINVARPTVKVDRDLTIGATSPWVKMSAQDAYKNYEDLTPSQYLKDLTAYKRAGDEELSYSDIVEAIDGRNPYKSTKDLKRERRRDIAASAISTLGEVLAHFINYKRTKNGNPAMNLSGLRENQQRIDNMRRRRAQMDRQAYETYLGMIDAERKERAAQVAADLKWRRELDMEALKQNSPLNEERQRTEKARQENIGANTLLIKERTEGQRKDNEYKPKKQDAELRLLAAREAQAKAAASKSNRDGGSKGNDKFVGVTNNDGSVTDFSEDYHGDGYVEKAYYYMLSKSGGDNSPYKLENKRKGQSLTVRDMIRKIAEYNSDVENNRVKKPEQEVHQQSAPFVFPWQQSEGTNNYRVAPENKENWDKYKKN